MNYSKHYCLLIGLLWLQFGTSQRIIGFNIDNGTYTKGIPSINSLSHVVIRLLGINLNISGARVALANLPNDYGNACDDEKDSNPFYLYNATYYTALISVNVEVLKETFFYFCMKTNQSSSYLHQGSRDWLTLNVQPPLPENSTLLPFPIQIFLICILLTLSGIFSGLNLGLMALDPLELQIVMKSGTKSEQYFASVIYPIRKRGNFLLCTLLLGNVFVNNTLTILLGDLTTGTIAILGATAAIVVLGEIVPQSICSRYGLYVGAHTIWLTKAFMVITYILSYPLSKILDLILGKEIGTVYNRKKLLEMLKVTEGYNDLARSEVNIIQGALELRSKVVEDVMTPIEHCFMVDIDSNLDFETMRKIMSTGYTRIPVYEKFKANVVSILFVKDLAFVDPDDCMPLRTVCKFYQHPLHFVLNDIRLDKLLEQFKVGAFHMAFVQRKTIDDSCEMVGIVTLEDVIEEIIKAEIVDETDVYTDNRRKTLNLAREKVPIDLSLFAENSNDGRKLPISPQLLLAAHRFLLAEVEPFRVLSDKVLLMLLKQAVCTINHNVVAPSVRGLYIYRKNTPSDYFILILEGQVKVIVGKESLVFQGGPFSFFGVPALTEESHRTLSMDAASPGTPPDSCPSPHLAFHPDYDLLAVSDVKYVKVSRKQYCHALNATKMATPKESGVDDVMLLMRTTSGRSLQTRGSAVGESGQAYYDVKGVLSSSSHQTVSPEQLMAIAAQYASVAGDRVRPATLMRSMSIPDKRDRLAAESSGSVKMKRMKSLDETDHELE